MGKVGARERMVSVRAADHGVYVAYLNMVGGQDELVFDGGSRVVGPGGETVAEAPLFEEALLIVDIDPGLVLAGRLRDSRRRAVARKLDPSSWIPVELPPLKTGETDAGTREALAVQPSARLTVLEKARRALVLGTRDYVEKNRFRDVLVAVSGGVDSALVAALAVEALGAGRVRGVFMPSEYTSDESREDAEKLAENLGIRLDTISIATIFEAYRDELKAVFGPAPPDVTEENLQARIRGDLIMALSNKWGSLVLTTGNKSEMSVGYATLYGDMAGGFAVIKDVPKLLVYDLCRLINQGGQGPVIPERILTKAPTAELRPGQKDTDSLPPYPVLDPIIKAYVEDEVRDVEVGEGCDTGCIERVIGLIDRAEYKRRQAPPGVKITPRAFGRDRRMPITNRYGLSGKDSDKDNDKK
jgi:NAD+ synthase (glutamine-hydrolysing)